MDQLAFATEPEDIVDAAEFDSTLSVEIDESEADYHRTVSNVLNAIDEALQFVSPMELLKIIVDFI